MAEPRTARILVVEDDIPLRRAMCRGLERFGHVVETADDGLTGWQLILAADPQYDLVITDSRMPRIPGRVLIAMVQERFPELRVLRVSGDGANDPVPDGIATLGKPFSLEELGRAVARALA
jgi:DNA-binding NtrC family response regulator